MQASQSTVIRWTLPPVLAAVLACAAATQSKVEGGDQALRSMDDVPAAVRTAAVALCGSDIKKISKEDEHGELLYEFEFVKNGMSSSATFSDRGALCTLEHVVDPNALPSTMLAEIQKRFPGATVEKAESTEVHGFEARIKLGGKTTSVEASASGHLSGGKESEEDEEEEEREEHGKK